MPGVVWSESEKEKLRQCVAEGLTARSMKHKGFFQGNGGREDPRARSANAIQKQMQHLGLADKVRSAIVQYDRANAWRGKDRGACIGDLIAHWRRTPVEVFAARWGVSPATIKYLLKQRGLGLTWKEAIQLEDAPFRDPEKRRQWARKLRENARRRREERRKALMAEAHRVLMGAAKGPRRRCFGCGSIFPLNENFFRPTSRKGTIYYGHLCLLCASERPRKRRPGDENIRVTRNRAQLRWLRKKTREEARQILERECRICFESWPLDRRFFKYRKSKHTGKWLYDHICRLCHAAQRRRRSSRASAAMGKPARIAWNGGEMGTLQREVNG